MRARTVGDGQPVVLIPSLGRGGADFDLLSGALAARGYRSLVLDPPGVEGVAPVFGSPPTLHDLARLVGDLVSNGPPVHVVGHAFGGRVGRCLAADAPDLVRSLVILGGGGRVPGDAEARRALARCFDETLSPAEHLRAVATAFFAPGNDPSPWAQGWWPDAARIERQATEATPLEDWWSAGRTRVLVVVGEQDRIAPVANGRAFVAEYPERSSLVVIEGAGHALLPERHDEVASAVLTHLDASS